MDDRWRLLQGGWEFRPKFFVMPSVRFIPWHREVIPTIKGLGKTKMFCSAPCPVTGLPTNDSTPYPTTTAISLVQVSFGQPSLLWFKPWFKTGS